MLSNSVLTIQGWIKATFLGWLLGVVLILVLSSLLDSAGIEHMQFYLGVGMGTGVGFTQWLFLKKSLKMDVRWFLYSILGMGLPFIIVDLLPEGMIAHKIATGISMGALTTGVMQHLLLKIQTRQAILWIPYSFIGWTMGVLTVFIIDYTMALKPILSNNLLLALINLLLILGGGLVLGFITGFFWKHIDTSSK
ncbi:MAG: hypothetical protein IPN36_10010 [Bacteroidetes bacterium]|nr:hypothetical protein [Bacteroidota bacterium]MBL0096198.1 hypothetical protein [Bacteroidota bacterium]